MPRLERLEHLETAANLDDVIDFALETGASPFGQVIMQDLARRLTGRLDLQQRLLETLEARYRNKVRALKQLRRAFAVVRALLPALPDNASPRMRLLWYLIALQNANHDGDPERIRILAGEYVRARELLKENDWELCADADLNLAVHDADCFAFRRAEKTINDWMREPVFTVLSPRQKARFYSALGQYRAMQQDAKGAEHFFSEALQSFSKALITENERREECKQTNTYRAINAIDGSLPVAPQALEAVFGAITPVLAKQFAADGSVDTQYQHQLLLRAFVLRPELSKACKAYLAERKQWKIGHDQHPWPSIHGHRGFLLWNQAKVDAATVQVSRQFFHFAIELVMPSHHGPTLKLIGAFWATIAACCYADQNYILTARNLLEPVRALPDAKTSIAVLESVLASPAPKHIEKAFAALPFNYR